MWEIIDVGLSTRDTVEEQYRYYVKMSAYRYPFTHKELVEIANNPNARERILRKYKREELCGR